MKYSVKELNAEGIRQWDSIKDNFSSSSILLGNGFSINFSDSLRYKYLYEFFIKNSTEISKNLFEVFQTKNFEQILESLEVAKTVCQTVEIENEIFDLYKAEIREGLINSINKIHPKPIDVNYHLIKWVSKQFKDFNQIFTTNYDLFLYYIILETTKFGDHMFRNNSINFNHFNGPDVRKKNHIYYLHGALFLFEGGLTTYKIKKPNNGWLLDAITKEIASNKYPLFISEGKSDTKLKSIQSNSYLSFCLNQLEKNQDKTLIIFGQSLSEQDAHIVKIIDKNYENIAISIRIEDWQTIGEIKAEKNRISSMFKKAKFEFYDSSTLFNFEPNE